MGTRLASTLASASENIYNSEPTTPHKNIETNSGFTRKIDISSHMESLKFQSGNDETA